MTIMLGDGSRDRRIEDPTNQWIIHPAGRALLPGAVARGISANWVSVTGLLFGTLAALAYSHWQSWPFAFVGLILSVCWLIADGLDGMIARATGTASAFGRVLDGVCDHGVFILIYVVLASSIGTMTGWALAIGAGAAHAVQSSLYEGERARFHRRLKGQRPTQSVPSRSRVVRGYDWIATSLDRVSAAFDGLFEGADGARLAGDYGARAARPLRLLALLSANMRVYAIFLACLIGNPKLFWWFELVPLSVIAIVGMIWHRRVETALLHDHRLHAPPGAAAL